MQTNNEILEARKKLFSKFKNNGVRGRNIPRRKVKRKKKISEITDFKL